MPNFLAQIKVGIIMSRGSANKIVMDSWTRAKRTVE
ncbi:hypothetical protein CLV00_2776 [Flavobacterium sp. 11]|nr:hypothetical protein CLV00_2776 [Flavobacterium sp. 11]